MVEEVIWGTRDFQVPKFFNFADTIDEWAQKEKEGKKQTDVPALWWIDGEGNEIKWSFQDVALNSRKTANVLSTAANIKQGDRVMVILPAIPEYYLMQAACLRTGGVLVVVPNIIGSMELHRRICRCKPVCMVAANSDQINKELLDVIDQIANSGEVTIRCRIMVNRIKEEAREGWLSFENVFETASGNYQSVKSLSTAPTNIFFSSGTTGNAKMIEHSQASMGMGGTGVKMTGFEETDLCWINTPTGWSVALNRGFFLSWSVGAGTFVHYKKMTAREALKTLHKYPITKAQFRPAIYMKALDENDLKRFRFPSLKCCFVGGEPSNKQMLRGWKEATGVELWDIYGQTELGSLTFHRESGNCSQLESVGKARPGIDMLIVDDDNQELSRGTTGRVVIRVKPYRPVNMFNCYVDEPEKTAACYSGDFYVTGDLGQMDADGHFYIHGRADDLFNCQSII